MERILPIFSFIPRRHPVLSRIPKDPILQHIDGIYRRRVLSILHCTFYPAFSNRFGRPVAEERLRVCDPERTVLTVIVATRANDVENFSVDNIFVFLVIQTIDIWPWSRTVVNQSSNRLFSGTRTLQEQHDGMKVSGFDD